MDEGEPMKEQMSDADFLKGLSEKLMGISKDTLMALIAVGLDCFGLCARLNQIAENIFWRDATKEQPEDYLKVLVYLPVFHDTDPIQKGWYISSLKEWRVEFSNASWKVQSWRYMPTPIQIPEIYVDR